MANNDKAIAAAKEFIAGLSEEAQKGFDGLGEDALAYMGNGVLRQSDYTKNQTALKQDRDKLDAWQKDANKQYGEMKEENISMKAQVAEAEARTASLAREFGVDPTEVKAQQDATGESAESAAASVQRQGGQAVEAPAVDNSKDWQEYANNTAETMASIALEAADIVGDHRDMFGDRISAMELAREAYQAGKPVREYYNEKYDVEAKQAEIDEKEKADWETKIRTEEAEKVRRELIAEGATLQPAQSANLNSPLFDADFGKEFMAGKEGKDGDSEGRTHPRGPRSEKDRMEVVMAAAKAFETEGLPRATSGGDATGY